MSKPKTKNGNKFASIRIKMDSKERAKAILAAANKKTFGKQIKLDQLIDLAIGLVTSEHIKMLQENSMTNEDRRNRLHQKYMELHGHLTQDQFIGLMLKPEFFEFIRQHGEGLFAA